MTNIDLQVIPFRHMNNVYSFRSRLGASLSCIIDNIYSSNVPLHPDIILWAWWHSILTV